MKKVVGVPFAIAFFVRRFHKYGNWYLSDFIKECKVAIKPLVELSFDTTINYFIFSQKRSRSCGNEPFSNPT
jgi:hypothetical protein